MRAIHVLALVFALAGVAWSQAPAEEEAERERRAKAMLALSKATCAVSIDAARKAAVKDDKPMVVFVGKTAAGCEAASAAGAVGVKVKEYTSDQPADPKAARVVILSKGSGGPRESDTDALYIRVTLPGDASEEAVKEAVRQAQPVSKSRERGGSNLLNWDVRYTPAYPLYPNSGTA